jgi:ribonucleoside-triphosphate reductase (formate)
MPTPIRAGVLGGLILNTSGKVMANYWLNHVYPPEVGNAHRSGALHIHDLDMLAGYCAGWSLRRLLHEGFNGVPGRVEAKPPKHFSAAIGQIVNFLGTLQNEWAGAQAFSSFDTYMAPFVRTDGLSYTQVRQFMQELIYNLNVPSRWGTQTPFTNLTFDWICPEDLRDQIPYVGGEEMPFTYGDLQLEMDMINRAYIEVMMEGDAKGRVFTFPIPTYNITKDFPWDHPNTERLFEMTAKYGLPYFQNFLNSDLEPQMVRSMCCRLQLDLRELLKRGNGLFGSAEQTGSLGVVTINCARIGFEFRGNEAGLYERLDDLLEIAKQSLEIKRKVVERLIGSGLYPYTQRYLGTLRNHFSTIGINGVNEMIRNFTGDAHDITSASRPRIRRETARPHPHAHD